MMFQDWIFLPFFAIVYLLFLAMRRPLAQNLWLLVASYIFYGWWHPLYPLLIGYATVLDYVFLWRMENSPRRRLWLTLSIANNVGLLSYFKYSRFVAENLNGLLEQCGAAWRIPNPTLILGMGVSFFVFRSISYAMDCYRRKEPRERNFIRHALFVSFFPVLIAGPVERARNLMPQLRTRLHPGREDWADGLSLFLVGVFKKLALADALAVYVNRVYGAPGDYSSAALLLATFAYAWQLYFDFSGYSDMARGVARLFGVRVMLNFNHPYLAVNLTDFWRRWHISLSTWFRDYLYIPLGGSRAGPFRTHLNLFITMVVSGLWHGAAWTFIVWGAIHGLGSILTRSLDRSTFYEEKVPRIVKQFLCFCLVCVGWVFFRASDFATARTILARIFSTRLLADPLFPLVMLGACCAVWAYQAAVESRFRAVLALAPVRVAMAVAMAIYLVFFTGSGGMFVYGAM